MWRLTFSGYQAEIRTKALKPSLQRTLFNLIVQYRATERLHLCCWCCPARCNFINRPWHNFLSVHRHISLADLSSSYIFYPSTTSVYPISFSIVPLRTARWNQQTFRYESYSRLLTSSKQNIYCRWEFWNASSASPWRTNRSFCVQ